MDIQSGSRRFNKLGLALVLLGVVGVLGVMAVTETSVNNLVPRYLELADEENPDIPEPEPDVDDHHRRVATRHLL